MQSYLRVVVALRISFIFALRLVGISAHFLTFTLFLLFFTFRVVFFVFSLSFSVLNSLLNFLSHFLFLLEGRSKQVLPINIVKTSGR